MKLYKALKLRKSLIGEISKLRKLISENNSYLEGSKNGEKFDAENAYNVLLNKINELCALKYVINEANREIQSKIYLLSEYKSLITFWNELNVREGNHSSEYGENIKKYMVHFDETHREKTIKEYQIKVNAIQDEIDEYNYLTDIPWGEMEEEELNLLEKNAKTDDDPK